MAILNIYRDWPWPGSGHGHVMVTIFFQKLVTVHGHDRDRDRESRQSRWSRRCLLQIPAKTSRISHAFNKKPMLYWVGSLLLDSRAECKK